MLKSKVKSLNGGWIKEGEDNNKCVVNKASIIKRLTQELPQYEKYSFVFNNLQLDSVDLKKTSIKHSSIILKIRINILNCDNTETIGSFIRTAIRLLTNYDPRTILFILDYSHCNDLNIDTIIKRIISNSTTASVFTNTILALDTNRYKLLKEKLDLSLRCIDIIDSGDINELLNNTQPFVINDKNGLLDDNLFKHFSIKNHYILLNYINIEFSVIYAPLIFQLISYKDIDKVSNNDKTFIICIEKISNLHRIHGLFKNYNLLNNLIICLPAEDLNPQNNYLQILDECKIKNIKTFRIDEVVKYIKSEPKNVIAIDIDESAIIYKYGVNIDKLANSIIIFGFESGGIPQEIIDLKPYYIMLESRSSINVVATVSIFLSSLY